MRCGDRRTRNSSGTQRGPASGVGLEPRTPEKGGAPLGAVPRRRFRCGQDDLAVESCAVVDAYLVDFAVVVHPCFAA
jgi:hypothetical protein